MGVGGGGVGGGSGGRNFPPAEGVDERDGDGQVRRQVAPSGVVWAATDRGVALEPVGGALGLPAVLALLFTARPDVSGIAVAPNRIAFLALLDGAVVAADRQPRHHEVVSH